VKAEAEEEEEEVDDEEEEEEEEREGCWKDRVITTRYKTKRQQKG
jgi:hypothetical protein